MRQIYNTAESPEMTFQMMDTTSIGGGSCDLAPKIPPQIESFAPCGQSSSNRNTLRLSLANLLPSRLAIYFFIFIFIVILRHLKRKSKRIFIFIV
jgi:hypothetical protein